MCDYSLESYKSRAAVDGEDLVIKRFPSCSNGFVSAADPDCAVCCKDGVEMTLHLRGTFQTRSIVKKELADAKDEEFDGEIAVTFHTLAKLAPPLSWGGQNYRDGFILSNGRYLSIQRLNPGTRATVTKALPKELTDAATKFDADIKLEMVPDYTSALSADDAEFGMADPVKLVD